MDSTFAHAPQDEPSSDVVAHFKHQAQRFQNAFDEVNKETNNSVKFIQRDIDRLCFEKSEPDAPIDLI